MWVLPTHKRPEKLRRFLAALAPQDAEEHVVLMVWRDDPRLDDYTSVLRDLPRTWDVWICEERTCGAKLNLAYERFPNETFYGLLTDDIQLGTPGMLRELREETRSGKFAWPNDGIHGPRMATHGVAPGRMLSALGFWAHPTFPHNGLDTVLYRVSEALGLSKYRADLHIIVRHPLATAEHNEMDETYKDALQMNSKALDDMYAFQQNVLPGLIQKARSAYDQSER